MLLDCENKARGKGESALTQFQSLVNTLTASLLRKSNDDMDIQYSRLDTQLGQIINSFYTAYALTPLDANKSMDLLVDYVGVDFKTRAALRVDHLKKQKASAVVNANGYIDRSMHLETLNCLVPPPTFFFASYLPHRLGT